ncbi:hypothetical protein G7Y89_g7673 [Cudoniella acicularis]|uniref:Uncharacterized protein n=1 Tax=Cudoniella acicularis TaxID=354080 RepID=A0A8H4RKS2_9HELO|nr:hypothetical protein G7Y89_g7673 [Cudoniella acicularis]
MFTRKWLYSSIDNEENSEKLQSDPNDFETGVDILQRIVDYSGFGHNETEILATPNTKHNLNYATQGLWISQSTGKMDELGSEDKVIVQIPANELRTLISRVDNLQKDVAQLRKDNTALAGGYET